MSIDDLNNSGGTPPAAPATGVGLDEVRVMLVALNRVLLAAGYSYFDCNERVWPWTPVLLVNNRQVLCLCPWTPERHEAVCRLWAELTAHFGKAAGLLLVGQVDIQHPAIEQLFQQAPGALAFTDAETHRYRISDRATFTTATPVILREDNFPRLLSNAVREAEVVRGHRELEEVGRQALSTQLQHHREQQAFRVAAQQASHTARPVITYVFLALCALGFLATGLAEYPNLSMNFRGDTLLRLGALFGPSVARGQWWRLFTYAFLHGGVIHILFNGFALYNFGMLIELWQGRWRLVIYMLFTTLTSALMVLFLSPQSLCIGISGAIFGLMGALIAQLIRHKAAFPPALYSRLWRSLWQMLGINFVISLMPGISLAGHLGGLLGGLLLALIISRSPVADTRLSRREWAVLALLLVGTVLWGGWVLMRVAHLS